MDPIAQAGVLDRLADDLRARLLERAGAADGHAEAHERIRALVDREAALLDEAAREQLDVLEGEGGAARRVALRVARDDDVDRGPGDERLGRRDGEDVGDALAAAQRRA